MQEKIQELNTLLEESDCLVSEDALNQALDKMADRISVDFADKMPIILCIMNGGLVPTAALLERFNFPLHLDYAHATRYGMEETGKNLAWIAYPQSDLKDRHILVIDDIFDQGHTLMAIQEWLGTQETASVATATIVNKMHERKVDMRPDYIGLDVEDRFVFGFGMDYQGCFRNLKSIHAVKGS